MDIATLIAIAVLPKAQAPQPTLWLNPNGQISIEGRSFKPRFTDGVRTYRTHLGTAYDFSGPRSGLHFGDLNQLKITGSMTVALWINPRSYVNDGPGAQILFRGDDRSGVDPYTLVIHNDGTINFGIQDEEHKGMKVSAELPLHRWSQVVANWDQETGFLRMWMNGECVAMARTSHLPFADLDSNHAPGVTVGNVQNDRGPHNQPFNGVVVDLRLYKGAWTPEDLGLIGRFIDPPVQARTEVKVD